MDVFGTRVAYHDVAPDGTEKLVLECHDGRRIECVLMAEGIAPDRVPEYAGWLRDGLRLLRQRTQGS